MKIFDCFMYYDEDLILDLRLNYLNNYVDYFIIVESIYTHSGKPRKPLFNINNFLKFKKKIKYILLEEQPKNLDKILDTDNDHDVNTKLILNAVKRENFQRNAIQLNLNEASSDDLIIISDVDEIPNLEQNKISQIKNKIIMFNQKFYCYKLNLKVPNSEWYGSKACKKKFLISPQWLRNIKDKIYPLWRLDTLFSKKKYQNIKIIKNGGWHFSNIKTAKQLEKKLKTYLHHREYELNPLGEKKIDEKIIQKKVIYNLKVDKRKNKFDSSEKLVIENINQLPKYLIDNIDKFKEWLD